MRSLIIQELRELEGARRTEGPLSLARLGAIFGGRDYSTISDVLEIPRAKLLEGIEEVLAAQAGKRQQRARLARQGVTRANNNNGSR